MSPDTLVAELTYLCPLRCAYCSNPIAPALGRDLDAADWARVFREAAALGVLSVHLTGGEPLLRADLVDIVRAARAAELYTHLVTSGLPDGAGRMAELAAAGLEAVQLSFQGPGAKRIAGVDAEDDKRRVAAAVRAAGLPLTVNVVLHRDNIAHVPALVALAEELGARRLELANVQLLGWALTNRTALLPDAAAIDAARRDARAARDRLRGRMEVIFVLPDHHTGEPRACMGGWGRRYLVVAPDGLALPCHAARGLPGLDFRTVRQASVGALWESPAFAGFRGEAWMPEPCQSCDRRAVDFGGCRCQAFQLTGSAAVADPACRLAPDHDVVIAARAGARDGAPIALRRFRRA